MPLNAGDPLFAEWSSGQTLAYAPGDTLPHIAWPFFMNEAAYYEKNIALVLGVQVTLPAIRTTVAIA